MEIGWKIGAHRGRVELVARERVDREGDARDEEWLAAEDHTEGGAYGALRADDREFARPHLVRVRARVGVRVRVRVAVRVRVRVRVTVWVGRALGRRTVSIFLRSESSHA